MSMRILIAGGTGLVGHALVEHWRGHHNLTVLCRKADTSLAEDQQVRFITWENLFSSNAENFDLVINLSGHNISQGRWTHKVQSLIKSSRVETTQKLAQWLILQKVKPRFFSTSAVGIYGLQATLNQTFDESYSLPWDRVTNSFLQEVGIKWEQATTPLIEAKIPVTITRFGVVLSKKGGFLKKLYPSFYFGAGAVIGDGNQPLSWIHIDDLMLAFDFLLEHPELTGAINLCSPQVVTQKAFAASFANVLHRPLWFKLPKSTFRFLFGQMGEELINHGQAVYPKRLLDAGFTFKYANIDATLKSFYG
jgi:uncharacterized protein (TIGR01777 family)